MSRASGARWRSAVAGVLIIVGTLAIPLAATASWVKAAAFDTDHFVATTAELRNDPAVQEAIVHGATQAIMTGLEIEARTRGGLAGLAELAGLPPRTSELLPALSGPIALAIEEFVEQQVGRVVESDQFGGLWDASARALHGQVLALLQADEGSLLGVEDGAISLRIGVVVDASATCCSPRASPWPGSSLTARPHCVCWRSTPPLSTPPEPPIGHLPPAPSPSPSRRRWR